MEKIKVAIVLPYFGPGGAEKMVAQLAAGMDPEAFHVEVFCVYGEPQNNQMEQQLQTKGIPIHYIRKGKGFSASAVVRLFRALDAFGPDVVHTHLYACVYAALWPVLRHRPMLHTFHTLPEIENKRPVRRILTRWLVRKNIMTPVVLSASNQRMVAAYYGLSAEQVPVVHNPVDLARFAEASGTTDDTFRFITVGRFSPEKNQQMMYRAFAGFLQKGYDARLVMLGKGEEEANLKSLAEELGIADRIDYAGYVNHVEHYLKNADVFLLSSHYEALPLAVLEAMAAGLPVISTDVGGIRDIVTDNGLLISADDVNAMTQAMERLYLEPATRHRMADAAVRNVQAYDVSNTATGYAVLYRRCSGRK